MYERIKGFRDIYPEEMSAQRKVIDVVESVARQYGFREIATPALERTQLYVEKSGDEIVDELYSLTDRGGREIALTPELTPTVARMVVEKQQELVKPIKWFSTRPFWRYEQVQQGRFREFYQTNVDIFGSASPEADAEILSFAADALVRLGLGTDDFEFRVSHRDILSSLVQSMHSTVDVNAVIRAVDKRSKSDRGEYLQLLIDAGLTENQAQQFDEVLLAGNEDLEELLAFSNDDDLRTAVENLNEVLEVAKAYGVGEHCTLSLTTARGLDYYTGVVFECFDTTGTVSRSIFGGGRYDDLIESFGGQPTPAVGVAPGVMNSTLPLLLQRAGVWPDETLTTDYCVLGIGDTTRTVARIARDLRERGNVVETDISGRSFGGQLEYADAIGAETVVIVGERDLATGEVTVKDMDSGAQVQVSIDDFPGRSNHPVYDDFGPGGNGS